VKRILAGNGSITEPAKLKLNHFLVQHYQILDCTRLNPRLDNLISWHKLSDFHYAIAENLLITVFGV
jgi:hypothetical protein